MAVILMDSKLLKQRQEKALKIIAKLKELYPTVTTVLNWSNPFELLVAVILSAQCTDKLVNKVTDNLFKKYKTVDDYANADLEKFKEDIHSVNFYNNKAKNIIAAAKMVKEKFGGKIPKTKAEMLEIPGVASKTANVVLGTAYHMNEGVAVDTHVKRLSKLLGLTDNDDPVKIEQDLMQILPREEWTDYNHRMVHYGRDYCPARPHDHKDCPLSQIK
jgi:endonuclease-3